MKYKVDYCCVWTNNMLVTSVSFAYGNNRPLNRIEVQMLTPAHYASSVIITYIIYVFTSAYSVCVCLIWRWNANVNQRLQPQQEVREEMEGCIGLMCFRGENLQHLVSILKPQAGPLLSGWHFVNEAFIRGLDTTLWTKNSQSQTHCDI